MPRRAAFAPLVSLLLATLPAAAQSPILVDRDAFTRKVQNLAAQVSALQQQARSMSPPPAMRTTQSDAAYQLQYGLQSLSEQLRDLDKDLRSLPTFTANNQADCAVPPPNREWDRDHNRDRDRDRDRDYDRDRDRDHGRDRVIIVQPPPPALPPPPPIVDDDTFDSLIEAVDDQAFSQDKLRVLDDAAASRWFRVDQVARLLDQLAFSEDKLHALQTLAHRIVDRQNTFKLYNSFVFANDKARARKILGP